jgi:TatA/E family protein of Tat protein translocase
MPNIGPVELVIILVIALLVIGPGKLPDVGSALGKSIREFRKAATDVQESVKLDAPLAPSVATPAPAVAVAAPPVAPAPVAPAPLAPAPVAPAPVAPAVVPIPVASALDTPAGPATPNELSAPVAPDPAATAAEAATEARV